MRMALVLALAVVACGGPQTPEDAVAQKPAPVAAPAAFSPAPSVATNLWPNPTSESNPPAGIVVRDDGTSPEWDYRANVGSAAFEGSWVRLLSAPAAGRIESFIMAMPCSEGESFAISAQAMLVVGGVGSIATVQTLFILANGRTAGSTLARAFFPAPNWTLLSVTGQPAPPGTVAVWFILRADPNPLTATVAAFDALTVTRLR